MPSKKTLFRWLLLLFVIEARPSVIAAEAPSPALLVVIKDENALGIVDPATKKLVGKVIVGNIPHDVVVSTDQKLAFVSNHGPRETNPGNTISVIDIAAQKEIRRVDIGPRSRPHGLWYAGGKLYFTAEGNQLIGCYNPATNQIEWRLGVGQTRTHLLLLTKDLNRIFASNTESNTVSVFERVPEPEDWSHTIIPVGKRPRHRYFSGWHRGLGGQPCRWQHFYH